MQASPDITINNDTTIDTVDDNVFQGVNIIGFEGVNIKIDSSVYEVDEDDDDDRAHEFKDQTTILFGLVSSQCMMRININKQQTHLDRLFPSVFDVWALEAQGVYNAGPFLLRFVDAVNLSCGILTCELEDGAVKRVCENVNTSSSSYELPLAMMLFLSRGFSWYNAYGYALRDDDGRVDVRFQKLVQMFRSISLADLVGPKSARKMLNRISSTKTSYDDYTYILLGDFAEVLLANLRNNHKATCRYIERFVGKIYKALLSRYNEDDVRRLRFSSVVKVYRGDDVYEPKPQRLRRQRF